MIIEVAAAAFGGRLICPNQADIIRYRKGMASPNGPFAGHGLVLIKGGSQAGIGMMDWKTNTLIGKSDGIFVDEGDFLVHDPKLCLDGIRRAYA